MSANPTNLDILRATLAKFPTLSDENYQAGRRQFATETGAQLSYLDKEYTRLRRERFKASTSVDKASAASDPWETAECLILGTRGEEVVFFDKGTKEVVTGVPTKQRILGRLSYGTCCAIAPGMKGPNYDKLISEIAERGKRAGIFDPSRIRGRGSWLDDSHTLLLHVGNRLLIEGAEAPLGARGPYLYTAGIPIGINFPPPLTAAGTEPIRLLFRSLRWRNPSLDPLLLMGHIVVAQIGGALLWRPHIFLTGASQNGKSTLLTRAIKPLMPFRFQTIFTAQSTEAGIRQTLGGDSLAWIFDESESKGDGSNVRKIFQMLRGSSSSANDEYSAKGTTHGRPLSFTLRACALLCAILPTAEEAADVSRVSVVELVRSSPKDYQQRIEPLWSTITPQLGMGLFSRVVHYFPALLANIELFRGECARRVCSMRGGDQLGTLLAGAFLYEHDGLANPELVARWLDQINWGEHALAARGGDEGDELRCYHAILGLQVDVNVQTAEQRDGGGVQMHTLREKRTLAELVDITRGVNKDDVPDAEAILARYGIRVETGQVWIANRNDALSKALAHYNWSNHAWRLLLRRLPGAANCDKPQKFAGVPIRYTSLPLDSTCPNCKLSISADDVVCQHCGKPMRDEGAPF